MGAGMHLIALVAAKPLAEERRIDGVRSQRCTHRYLARAACHPNAARTCVMLGEGYLQER